MSYTALYRKYRPEKFSDVIGQEHITDTLRNQIRLDRVGHAYLFTGSRGVGKTTCARIFARAINCTESENGEPCGKCGVCEKLGQPNNLDIIEIDAASNNGVDEARELRERVKYPPVCGKYKVFIIDEAHMLTGGAANALLKTLEEPPKYAVFILATTEAHRLPATILSRCMRFDFRLVGLESLEKLISQVFDSEGKAYEPEAVRAIALAGEGSVRDSLSIADKCFAASDGKLTYGDVMRLIGLSDEGSISELFDSIMNSDISAALKKAGELTAMGKSPSLTAKELASYARNLLLSKAAPELLNMPEPRKNRLLAESQSRSVSEIAAVMEIFDKVGGELRLSANPTITLEIAIFRACKLFGLDISALETRVDRLEKLMDGITSGMPVKPRAEAKVPIQTKESPSAERNKDETVSDLSEIDKKVIWGRILSYLHANESGIIYNLFSGQTDYSFDGKTLTIVAADKDFFMLTDDSTAQAFGRAVKALRYDIKLKVVSPDNDRNKELERIKKMIGDTPIKIID